MALFVGVSGKSFFNEGLEYDHLSLAVIFSEPSLRFLLIYA